MQNESPFSLAFLESERELGARIGYPALVYDGPKAKQCDGYPQLTGCPNQATVGIFGVWSLCDTCGTRFRVEDEQVRQTAALIDSRDDAHDLVAELRAENVTLREAIAHMLEVGNFVFSRADNKDVFSIHLSEETYNEFAALIGLLVGED